MKLVHVIADYGPGDLAFSEMISALARHLPADAHWHTTPVESFNTLATDIAVRNAEAELMQPLSDFLRQHALSAGLCCLCIPSFFRTKTFF